MRPVGQASILAAHTAAFVAIVLWGISFVATKAVLAEIGPTTLAFTRFAIGTLTLFLLLGVRRTLGRGVGRARKPDGRAIALMGIFGVFVHQMLQVFALQWTTATNTGWLIGLIPIWAALLGAAFLGERFSGLRLVGLTLGLSGALLVVTGHADGRLLPSLASTRGDLLVIASTVNWAAYTVFSRRFVRVGGGLRTTAYSMAVGTAFLAGPFVLNGGWSEWPALTRQGWTALLFLAVGCSGIAYLCWSIALERLEASSVAAWLYLEPFVTQLSAAALLGEPVTARIVVGGSIVLVGVWLVQRRTRGQASRPARA